MNIFFLHTGENPLFFLFKSFLIVFVVVVVVFFFFFAFHDNEKYLTAQ